MIKICDEIYAIETAIYLNNHKTLILADLHFGFEENLHRQGVLVPKRQYMLMMDRLKRIISKVEVDRIVLNGDVKHEFGRITRQEWQDINAFLDFCSEKFKEIRIIKGNHDPILKFLINKRKINERKEINIGNVLITHGDYVPNILNDIIIIGHEHPAIILTHEAKSEKYKCFLKGNFENKTLIVQPSFNPLTEGTNVRKEKKFGPFLDQDLSDFEVFIYDDSTKKDLYFGQMKKIN